MLDEADAGHPVEDAEQEVSLRDQLAAAMSEQVEEDAQPEPEAADNGPARDESGRFAKATDEQAEAEPEPEPKQDEPVTPPTSWNAEARALFEKADPGLRAYILRREQEQQQGVQKLKETYAPQVQLANEITRAMAPYQTLIAMEGGTPATVVQSMLRTAAIMKLGSPSQKTQALREIAEQYGVDLGGLGTDQEPADPRYSALERELYDLKSQWQQQSRTAQEQERAEIAAEIESFRANAPHFDEVKPIMAALLQSGQAGSLKEAYEAAIYAKPDVREKVLADQRAESERKRADAAAEKAAVAKRKAVSVNGAPGMGSSHSSAPAPTLRAELERSFNVSRA